MIHSLKNFLFRQHYVHVEIFWLKHAKKWRNGTHAPDGSKAKRWGNKTRTNSQKSQKQGTKRYENREHKSSNWRRQLSPRHQLIESELRLGNNSTSNHNVKSTFWSSTGNFSTWTFFTQLRWIFSLLTAAVLLLGLTIHHVAQRKDSRTSIEWIWMNDFLRVKGEKLKLIITMMR